MKRVALLMALVMIIGACGDVDGAAPIDTAQADAADTQEDTMPDASDTTPPAEGGGDQAQPAEGGDAQAQPVEGGDAQEQTTEPATAEGDSPTTTNAPSTTDPAATLELNPVKETPLPPPSEGPPVGASESLYPAGQIDPGLSGFIDMAIADLASRLGAEPADITAISAVLVTWSDSSLGCPQPGMEYLQVLQDGSLIELGHAAKVYRYHSGGSQTPFLCSQPLTTPPIPVGGADV